MGNPTTAGTKPHFRFLGYPRFRPSAPVRTTVLSNDSPQNMGVRSQVPKENLPALISIDGVSQLGIGVCHCRDSDLLKRGQGGESLPRRGKPNSRRRVFQLNQGVLRIFPTGFRAQSRGHSIFVTTIAHGTLRKRPNYKSPPMLYGDRLPLLPQGPKIIIGDTLSSHILHSRGEDVILRSDMASGNG